MNRQTFFNHVRLSLFRGSLSQAQVSGMSAILDEWDQRQLNDVRWLSYMLATTFHETAQTMTPIREYGRGAGKAYGTTYYGRGFVQLTWAANYKKAGTEVGADLVSDPDRALELPIATKILFDGMIDGWFTGKSLGTYISGTKCDYTNARRIINGTDRAAEIAVYAQDFEAAVRSAVMDNEPAPSTPVKPVPAPITQHSPKPAPTAPKAAKVTNIGSAAVVATGGAAAIFHGTSAMHVIVPVLVIAAIVAAVYFFRAKLLAEAVQVKDIAFADAAHALDTLGKAKVAKPAAPAKTIAKA